MQKWDYYVVECNGLDLEEIDVKKGSKKARYSLDPALEWEVGIVRGVAWSNEGKYWTRLWKILAEMGEDGWELVATTPPFSHPYGGSGPGGNPPTNFCLLFKRLRV